MYTHSDCTRHSNFPQELGALLSPFSPTILSRLTKINHDAAASESRDSERENTTFAELADPLCSDSELPSLSDDSISRGSFVFCAYSSGSFFKLFFLRRHES